jgi:hypothetical protein
MLRREVQRALLLAAALVFTGAACGESGSRETRPAEVLFRVSGSGGTRFRVGTAADECLGASGIQSPNTDHQFGDRVFEAPHFFILENAFQPIRGAFLVPEDETEPISVDLFLGLQLRSVVGVNPGDCRSVETGVPVVEPPGRNVRIEVCGSLTEIPRGANCGDFQDDFIGFFISIGDSQSTNLTSCAARPIAEACRTPATVFIQEPKDEINAIFDTLSGENPDAILRVELYVNDELVDASSGKRNVIVEHEL